MPEQPEVETERLREAIEEEHEREGTRFLKAIALTTAILAGLAAIAALKAGATVNEALFHEAEAARLQAEASDEWGYYQAKGIKATVEEASRSAWLAAGKQPPSEAEASIKRHAGEQQESQARARQKEAERDERAAEAEHLLHRHHRFANCVAVFQVAIALGAVAALTRQRLVWYGSLGLGLAGAVLLLVSFLH